jgi:EAL domain-containing protein (putative c-di-GMP-specific phosphodiesterase class I)
MIRLLKTLGCRFSLDDFGSGLSSFGYLKSLPVDFLKIDGSFVKDMNTDSMNHAIVEAIHRVGHSLSIRTIAEFVENREIAEQLQSIGVDFGQGYHFSKPEPLF